MLWLLLLLPRAVQNEVLGRCSLISANCNHRGSTTSISVFWLDLVRWSLLYRMRWLDVVAALPTWHSPCNARVVHFWEGTYNWSDQHGLGTLLSTWQCIVYYTHNSGSISLWELTFAGWVAATVHTTNPCCCQLSTSSRSAKESSVWQKSLRPQQIFSSYVWPYPYIVPSKQKVPYLRAAHWKQKPKQTSLEAPIQQTLPFPCKFLIPLSKKLKEKQALLTCPQTFSPPFTSVQRHLDHMRPQVCHCLHSFSLTRPCQFQVFRRSTQGCPSPWISPKASTSLSFSRLP